MKFPFLVFENYEDGHSSLLGYFEKEEDAKLYATVNNTYNGKKENYTNSIVDLAADVSFKTDYIDKYKDCAFYKHTFTLPLKMKDTINNTFSIDDIKSVSKTDYTTSSEYVVFENKDKVNTVDTVNISRESDTDILVSFNTYSTDTDLTIPTKKYFKNIDEIIDKLYVVTGGNDNYTYDNLDTAIEIIVAENKDLDNLQKLVKTYPEDAKRYVDLLPNTDVIVVDDSIAKVNATSIDNISEALNDPQITKMKITVAKDINTDSSIKIPEGKSVEVNLNGKTIKSSSELFLVYPGSTLTIDGGGTIGTTNHNYNAIAAKDATVYFRNATIDNTTDTDRTDHNYAYGIYAMNDAKIYVENATIHTIEASGISTNNTTGSGTIEISGNTVITTDGCAAVYLANNDKLVVKDNSIISGGIFARMGNISIEDHAKVINIGGTDIAPYFNTGSLATKSGVEKISQAILAHIGMYKADSTKFNLKVADTAIVNAVDAEAIAIGKVDTLAATEALVELQNTIKYKVYSHDELAALAKEDGKTLKKAAGESDVIIKIKDDIVYPEKEETVKG